jgi:hypothetical protein
MPGAKGRSGGHRSGAGGKLSEARILGLIGPKAQDAPEPASLVEVACPADCSPEVAAVWAELAEHARKNRTLVASTATAFRRMCEAIVRHAKMQAQIDQDGLTYLKVTIDGAGQEHTEVKAHPLISRASTLENAIRSWMKDFAIHPFGKPVIEPKAAAVDPFAKFGAAG